ncbi:hypothetical protein LBMAG46_23530 [Planctomycetia bacterium]|nr:hypothetical protein LBMAG46_23530 [Planctomycetia bacterium]
MFKTAPDLKPASHRTSPAHNHRMIRPRCNQNVSRSKLQADIVIRADLADERSHLGTDAEGPAINRRPKQIVARFA